MPVVMSYTNKKIYHIEDTVNGCYLAWKKFNRHYSVSHAKNYSMIQVKMFSPKLNSTKRLGERYKSSVVKKLIKSRFIILNIKS